MTLDGLIKEMDRALQFPGVSNAWTMPIKARIDMLSTGIRTPVGVKVIGQNLAQMEGVAREIETVLKSVPGTSSAYAERVMGGYYLEILPNRARLARYGLMISDVQNVVATALGAEPITTTVEGRERYTVAIRYPRDLRSDPQSIAKDVLVSLPGGGTVPLGEVADIKLTRGATSIRTENAKLATYVFVDIRDRDLGGYVADAQEGRFRTGQTAGRYLSHLERAVRIHGTRRGSPANGGAGDADDHLPAALSQLPTANRNPDRHAVATVRTRRWLLVAVVAWLQSVRRRSGWVHCVGGRRRRDRRGDVDLSRQCYGGDEGPCRNEGRAFTRSDLYEAIMIGAVERVRPKMMTVVAIMAGLLPILWSTGTGSEVMQRIAVPMIGGMVSSTLLTLVVIPAIYGIVKGWGLTTVVAARKRAWASECPN